VNKFLNTFFLKDLVRSFLVTDLSSTPSELKRAKSKIKDAEEKLHIDIKKHIEQTEKILKVISPAQSPLRQKAG
jgi:hypothetical protein